MDRMTIRVVVVDDHPAVLEGLTGALGRNPSIEVDGTATTVAGAKVLIDEVAPDVALIDLRLPDGSGTDLLAHYQNQETAPAFIVLSTFLTDQYVNAAIALGASGFLLKTTSTDRIVAAIEDVVGGKLAYTAEQLRASWRAGWTPLTSRERDIIEGVMSGRSNDELSARLHISRKTVEAYLSRLFERFGVLTRTELAVLADPESEDLITAFLGRVFQVSSIRLLSGVIGFDGGIQANLHGVDSHGVVRLPHYLERIRRGSIKAQPQVRVTKLAAACTRVDGDDGLGHVVMFRAAEEALALARESGACGMRLYVEDHNATAQQVYRRLGMDARSQARRSGTGSPGSSSMARKPSGTAMARSSGRRRSGRRAWIS